MEQTQELTLPISGKQVIIRGYVTGLIDREVKKVQASANKMRFEVDAAAVDNPDTLSADSYPPGTKLIMEPDPTAQLNADQKLLELMVTALDGNTGDVFNRLLELPAGDVQFVSDKVKAVQQASEVKAGDPKAPAA